MTGEVRVSGDRGAKLAGLRFFLASAEAGVRAEEAGLAWRFYDVGQDDFIWRFRERRWKSVPTAEIMRAGMATQPYFLVNAKICCDPDRIPTHRLQDGSLIAEDCKRLQAQLDYEERQS